MDCQFIDYELAWKVETGQGFLSRPINVESAKRFAVRIETLCSVPVASPAMQKQGEPNHIGEDGNYSVAVLSGSLMFSI